MCAMSWKHQVRSRVKRARLLMPCFSSLRNPIYRTAHQPRGCDWGDAHGFAVRIWGRQLSIHLHVLLSQVTAALWNVLSTFLRFFFFCFTCGINSSFFIAFFSETNYCHVYMLEPFLLPKHILLIQASLYFMGMCVFPLKWDSWPNWVSSFCRNVTDADILALERRLLQTMDMIVSKKKRWEGSSSMKLFISSVFSQYGIRWFLKLQKLLVLLGLHVPVNR